MQGQSAYIEEVAGRIFSRIHKEYSPLGVTGRWACSIAAYLREVTSPVLVSSINPGMAQGEAATALAELPCASTSRRVDNDLV